MSRKKKILIIDDDIVNLEIVAELLEDEYEIQTLESGEKALETIREIYPDLIILDIMMPGANGYEICKEIKADDQLKDITVLLISAKAMLKETKLGFEAGADDYITKPFEHTELQERIKSHLNIGTQM